MMLESGYDVVILGGGIHGAGVAQAAAASGHTVLLLEKDHPAAGTSSRSSKLIHGGLRYLESAQLSLVRESLRERELLLENAPDLVKLVPFCIPIYQHTRRRPWQVRAGLSLYAMLGGCGPHMRFKSLPKPQWERFEGLKTEGLQAVFQYFDAQTDDAELTRAVLRSAHSLGAESLFPAQFLSAQKSNAGYRLAYRYQEEDRLCEATVLINAAGPWINQVQQTIRPSPPRMEVELVQGTHIVLDRSLGEEIFYVEAPRDGRAVFVMPWKETALVGTTETAFEGPPDQVEPLAEEIEYLEETLQAYFPDSGATTVDQFAGLRVLPGGDDAPFGRARETPLMTDHDRIPHYLAIYGGKLTGYRATAEKVMKVLRNSLPDRTPVASTRELKLTRD